jgi:hypothetical protein
VAVLLSATLCSIATPTSTTFSGHASKTLHRERPFAFDVGFTGWNVNHSIERLL